MRRKMQAKAVDGKLAQTWQRRMPGGEGMVSLKLQSPWERLRATLQGPSKTPCRTTGALTEDAGDTTACIFVSSRLRYRVWLSPLDLCCGP